MSVMQRGHQLQRSSPPSWVPLHSQIKIVNYIYSNLLFLCQLRSVVSVTRTTTDPSTIDAHRLLLECNPPLTPTATSIPWFPSAWGKEIKISFSLSHYYFAFVPLTEKRSIISTTFTHTHICLNILSLCIIQKQFILKYTFCWWTQSFKTF